MTPTPSGVPSPKTTEVMVILTARQGIGREQIMKVMPAEIRATVKLYLDGKIRHWYSRGEGRGVVLFLDVKCNASQSFPPTSSRCFPTGFPESRR